MLDRVWSQDRNDQPEVTRQVLPSGVPWGWDSGCWCRWSWRPRSFRLQLQAGTSLDDPIVTWKALRRRYRPARRRTANVPTRLDPSAIRPPVNMGVARTPRNGRAGLRGRARHAGCGAVGVSRSGRTSGRQRANGDRKCQAVCESHGCSQIAVAPNVRRMAP